MKFPYHEGYCYDTAVHGWLNSEGKPVSDQEVEAVFARRAEALRQQRATLQECSSTDDERMHHGSFQ